LEYLTAPLIMEQIYPQYFQVPSVCLSGDDVSRIR
jgi:hypothetical protein